jgi:hypothetical protein
MKSENDHLEKKIKKMLKEFKEFKEKYDVKLKSMEGDLSKKAEKESLIEN